jgi:hypothetical protein
LVRELLLKGAMSRFFHFRSRFQVFLFVFASSSFSRAANFDVGDSKIENKKDSKNVSFWKAFLEFSLADLAPEQYLQAWSAEESLELILKTNPQLLPKSVNDFDSAQKYFSFHPLAMSSELIYLNSSGNVYRVIVFDPSDLEKMRSGKEKSTQLKWRDPDTRYVHSLRASLKMVDPSNDNYETSFSILPYNLRKSFQHARLEVADGSNAAELISLSLMAKLEELSQAVNDEERKKMYEHKVTKKSFMQAIERSKKIFENDSSMLKFLEKVSSGLTSLE